ncbi:MFS transporter [Sandaracinomonas limnophila]|uniref:MFS transporter n=1 Tax=Sandaracinomonas limnophila TaxID=1862386 RepID=A0A437PP75_9BACT|nr:MFS transporter [Sandaracinomonas limnophila]RVU24067.1 MFS transporter [Sandaracinomonas limnophila]
MSTPQIKLGLKENWQQFTLLVIANMFVGGMVGLERTIFPQFAAQEFGVTSKFAVLSFIIAFGFSKAISNYFTGKLANRYGRKNLLVWGWLLAFPIPLILIYAPNWNWVVFANILLGVHQGLAWSSTVVMKIDLVGEKDRGLAMGLNEFAGYLAVGIVAYLSGWVANRYGITPYPFYIGIALSVLGLLTSWIWIKDTRGHVVQEQGNATQTEKTKNLFWLTSFKNKTLSSVTQAGLVNNLNDGMIWGLLPILLFSAHLKTEQIGLISAVYPTVWGISQLFTGKMSDIYSKKAMLFWGMLIQGIAIILLPLCLREPQAPGGLITNALHLKPFPYYLLPITYYLILLTSLLGFGTALVYPTFLSTIAQVTRPVDRAESIGVFRLWRDAGYAFGAIISGITADLFGLEYAIYLIGGITVLSAFVIQFRMPRILPTP